MKGDTVKQILKIGAMTVLVAALAAGSIAYAQSTDEDEAPVPGTNQAELTPAHRPGHHKGHKARKAMALTAEFLGVEPGEIADALQEGSTVAAFAASVGSSGDAVVGYLTGELSARLDEAVESGRMTVEQAAEKLAEAEEKLTTWVGSTLEEMQEAAEARRAEKQAEREARQAERQATLEEIIGLPFDEIEAQLQSGSSLAAVAEGQGISVDDLVEALVAELETNLAQKVAAGEITQEQADARIEDAEARITFMVERVPGDGPGFGWHGHGRRGHGRGFGGFGGNGFGPGGLPVDSLSV
jgi:hypothetical protein